MSNLYDIEAEKALIASVFLGGNEVFSKVSNVEPSAFYHTGCRLIWEVIRKIHKKGENIDVIAVSDLLKQSGNFEKSGGMEFLTEIISSVGTSVNSAIYASIVLEKSARRNILPMLKNAENLAEQGSFDDFCKSLENLKLKNIGVSDTPSAVEIFEEFFKLKMEQKDSGQKFTGIKTGFKKLDVITGGLQKGDYILIGARPSMGKTAFMCDISRNVAKLQDCDVYIFSLEMSKEALISRFASREFNINNQKWKTPALLENEDILNIQAGADSFENIYKNIFIIDNPNMTVSDIYRTTLELASRRGRKPALVCIDYLQRIFGEGQSSVNVFTNISRELKTFARDMDCPMIVLSQLSRVCETRADKRPVLSDIRESGAIEQDADLVAFLYRDEYYFPDTEKKGMAELIIQKHRNGELGIIDLIFKKEFTAFYNPEMRRIKNNG